jgi:hypothetical protein
MADWPDFINDLPVTADFVYIRRHGEGGNYATHYTAEQLKNDAKRIKEYLKQGKDVYYYLNNDAFAHAPKNGLELKAILESTLPKSLTKKPEEIKVKVKKKMPEKKKVEKKEAEKKKAKTKKPVKKTSAKKTASKAVKKAPKKTTAKPAKKTAPKKAKRK